MKELLVLSGKGGTGKTTIASALIKLLSAQAYADCDVDAPNLHLIAGGSEDEEKFDYYGLPKAHIEENLCIKCGKCMDICRFNAIQDYQVDKFSCEGCSVCTLVCPTNAISLKEEAYGEVRVCSKPNIFSSAKLNIGSGSSGKLVSEVKKHMRIKAKAKNVNLAVIDGSPGVGCPVIASISGVTKVLIVAEPSISGISDMERIIETAYKLGANSMVCINKYDISPQNTSKIEEICKQNNIPCVGKIPFDKKAVEAINEGLTIVEKDCDAGKAIREIYDRILELI